VITTPELISLLAANATPVRRLRPPLTRVAIWLLFAACILSLLAVGQGVRSDIAERMEQPVFVVGIASSLLTGVLAAIASFMASLPDRSRLWSLLPVPALGMWMSTIGYGCLTNWVSIGPNGMLLGETVRCFVTLVLTSVPLSLAMVVMLRYAALLRPTDVIITGSLAVSAITAMALSLFHSLDATIMILIWNLGTAVLIVGLGRMFGRRMFLWVAPRSLLH
jgi:hypothetical protein